MHKRYPEGFTLVELLVVIVVIAILATVSVVTYAGVQSRAHDTAVQSDLRNVYNKSLVEQALEGQFMELNEQSPFAYGSYLERSEGSIVYAYWPSTGQLAVAGVSKSGQAYAYNNGTLEQIEPWSGSSSCELDGYFSRLNGVYQVWSGSDGWVLRDDCFW